MGRKRFSFVFPTILIFFSYSCGNPEFVKEIPNTPKAFFKKSYVVQDIVGDKADILWVVDNSGSMGSYQRSLIHNMDVFIQAFTQISSSANWKMGLLSTDVNDTPYVGFDPTYPLDSSSSPAIERFNKAISGLGVNGDPKEQAFGPIRNALTKYPHFLRKNSKLFIIIVSDELEQSGETATDFLAFLHTLRPPHAISTYGIFEKQEDNCGYEPYKGTSYHSFIQQTNGLTFPICAPDYGSGLAEFGADIARKIITPRIILEHPPVVKSIKVIYQGNDIPGGVERGYWRYNADENAIVFHNLGFLKANQQQQAQTGQTGQNSQQQEKQEAVQVFFEKITNTLP